MLSAQPPAAESVPMSQHPEAAIAPTGIPAEPAETQRFAEVLARLAPALDAFAAGHDGAPFPPYRARPGDPGQGPLPDDGVGLDATVDELGAIVRQGSRISSPGFVGFITTGASTSGAAALTATAFAGGQRYTLHAFNAIEHASLRWLADLCGLPDGVTGVYSSGGSSANIIALGTARQAAYERRGHNVAEDGAPAGLPGRIYASSLAHRTVHRAAAVLGLGRRAVVPIPVDPDGRALEDELEAALATDARAGIVPVAVVACAGATDTGSVDRIDRLGAIARRHGAWLHVDGAYGLVANASPRLRPLFAGVEAADSWIVDPHKWLATGVGVGATFVRDADVLTRAFAEGEAAYLEGSFREDLEQAGSQFDAMGGPWGDQSLELSAPPRGIAVWAVLREIGLAGVVARVERHVAFAREVAERVRAHPRLELLMEPQLSVVCYRYRAAPGVDADELNRAILDRLRRETVVAPSGTQIGGRFAIRPCFINPRTTDREVAELVDAVVRFGDELTGA
jgi:aromatic-L-amino-acid decarboxylase